MIRLEVLRGQEVGRTVESDQDLVRIGRADRNDLVVTDHHVSGEHASIAFNGEHWVLRDHHSTNGTRVARGSELLDLAAQPGREVVLLSGDVLQLGEASGAVHVSITLDDEDDGARIVSVRQVADLGEVEQAVDRELLHSLYEAQRAISAVLELEQAIDVVAAQVFRFLSRATHVTVALREDEEGKTKRSSRYVPVGTRIRDVGASAEAVPITRSVFKKVVQDRAAVLAADARRDVGETASLMAAQILSTIGVPLWQGDEILGVLQVDNRAAKGLFKESDLDLLALLAQSASLAFANTRLVTRLRGAEERQRTENVYLKRREERRRFDGIIGESRAMKSLFDQLKKVVDTRVTVLIEGETGTGKELVSSAVHYWSNRREKLFVAQNCAALPENLLESELFGHKKGSFTGATDDKKGLFELAHEGTLFLDEVGEMPLTLQAKLLRVLQEGEVRPVGANHPRKVDVRIVAATNRDLETEVREGRFREDLYYRLKVFPLRLPSLRERREDIPLLAGHFLKRYAEEFGRTVRGFSQQAMEQMQGYPWPGNVRELENEVQRLVIQVDDDGFIQPTHLSPRIRQSEEATAGRFKTIKGTLKEMVEHVEKQILREALEEHDNNKSATAKTLGITREGLHKKLKGYGMT
ncbi:MAG: sigma 54-interacting transcriptional regulator [Sandaracinus sp.]|nr:sigma 54-interacting transcriptional regulator [Myxococcales bacterium]MCB9614648.1 sigma 54-interacting transcriptional regulator [Sandaracinus sp.]MCB9624910.1 sigma 54-interacting transcriptional regulator [Sandaracinus sp.]MCB9632375.1 sigma 54-interacting transcriptional regulator [Sandaracinus sp.]